MSYSERVRKFEKINQKMNKGKATETAKAEEKKPRARKRLMGWQTANPMPTRPI